MYLLVMIAALVGFLSLRGVRCRRGCRAREGFSRLRDVSCHGGCRQLAAGGAGILRSMGSVVRWGLSSSRPPDDAVVEQTKQARRRAEVEVGDVFNDD